MNHAMAITVFSIAARKANTVRLGGSPETNAIDNEILISVYPADRELMVNEIACPISGQNVELATLGEMLTHEL